MKLSIGDLQAILYYESDDASSRIKLLGALRSAYADDHEAQAILDQRPSRTSRTASPGPRVRKAKASGRRIAVSAAAAALAVLLAIFIWTTRQPEPAGSGDAIEKTPPPNCIAVLPFANASSDPDDAYLSEGFSDELRDQLGRVAGLRIAARSSSIALLEQPTGATVSAAILGVAVLVEGSLRRRGDSLHISVQLIEGSSGLALWSQSYDQGQELLAVQQAIVEQVVHHVLPEPQEVVATPATRNASANEFMLLARYHEQQVRAQPEVDVETLLEVIRLYREATEVDPESALAHSRLAGALVYLGDLTAAEAPIFWALTLDAELSEVQDTLGKYYWARDLPGAGPAWRRALELNPNNADALSSYAYWIWQQGEDNESEALYRRALELDPLSLSRYGDLGSFLGTQGRAGETLEIIRRVEELFEDASAFRLIARLLELTGNIDHSIAWTIRARDLEPANPTHVWQLAELYAEIGDFDTALQLEPEPGIGLLFKMRRYQELIDVAELLMIEEPNDVMVRYLLAFAYNTIGKFAPAVRILSATGLPGAVMEGNQQGSDLEAFITLVNAINGTGDTERARDHAEWFITTRQRIDSSDWWVHTYRACALVILGRDAEALQQLEHTRVSPRLPWNSVLGDLPCFQGYSDEPSYQAVLCHVESRRAELRTRLPLTLADYGVFL